MDVPLFVSRRRLAKLNKLPRAKGQYSIDSGGFSELSLHGQWTVSIEQYIAEVRRWMEWIGPPVFAAEMDHMCEPFILQKTRKTVLQHQQLTVQNFLELMSRAQTCRGSPSCRVHDRGILDCVSMFEKAGVRLAKLPLVGLAVSVAGKARCGSAPSSPA